MNALCAKEEIFRIPANAMYSMTGGDKEILAGMMGEKKLYELSKMRNGMEGTDSGKNTEKRHADY